MIPGDETPPALVAGSVSIGPDVAAAGTTLVAHFEVDKPLGADPHVRLDLGDEAGGVFRLDEVDDLAFTFGYPITGTEPEGTWPALVTLVDAHGNLARDLPLGTVTLDFTPPVIVEVVALHPGVAREGGTLEVRVTTGEPLAEAPVVRIPGQPDFALLSRDDNVFVYAYEVDDCSAEGPTPISVRARDAAGNAVERTFPAVARIDCTPPSVVEGTVYLPDAVVRSGGVAAVSFTVDETLSNVPSVVLVSEGGVDPETEAVFSNVGVTGREVSASHVISGVADGTHLVVARGLVDVAGNVADDAILGTLVVDGTAPGLEGTPVVEPESRVGTDGAVLSVSVTLDEPAAHATGSLQIGDRSIGLPLQTSLPATDLEFVHTVAEVDPEGIGSLLVQVADAAGNVATLQDLGLFAIDRTPPEVASASVAYVPAADNPLGIVSAAKLGTTIRIVAIPDEAIDPDFVPRITLTLDDEGGDSVVLADADGLEATAHDSASATFEVEIVTESITGDYRPSIVWRDRAGNENDDASFTPPRPIRVKTRASDLRIAQEEVTYLRSPTGNAADEDLGGHVMPRGPHFSIAPHDTLSADTTLSEEAFSFQDGELLEAVHFFTDPEGGWLLGTATPVEGRWPRAVLRDLDAPVVWVRGLDEAGNFSDPVRIQNVEWVATSNAPPLGASPHRMESTVRAGRTVALDPRISETAGEGLEGSDGLAVLARAEAAWMQRVATLSPAGRRHHAMAFDAARGRVVLFGGRTDDGLTGQTWEWDGESWRDRTPEEGGPAPRQNHAMAYDAARDRVVLFGGGGAGGSFFGDTWEWNGEAWTQLFPEGPMPAPRQWHGMVHDAARGQILLVGGADEDYETLAETWLWRGDAWQLHEGDGVTPAYGALAYDQARQRVVSFDGETWEWDGDGWTLVASADVSPAQFGGALAFDPAAGVVRLFGGYHFIGDGYVVETDEMWTWDGESWDWVPYTVARPIARSGHAMTSDPHRQRMVLFGGTGASPALEDTWEWDGERWSERRPEAAPPWRNSSAMAYDAGRERLVLFGGQSVTIKLQDTWEWDGESWLEMSPAGALPDPRVAHRMAYDPARGVVVLFGGIGDGSPLRRQDTWEWDGEAWNERSSASGETPDGRGGHGLAYDGTGILLFGGNVDAGVVSGETWRWDGSSWSLLEPSVSPPARRAHTMVYDEARQRVVLFGGVDSDGEPLADTWTWNGDDWSEWQGGGTAPTPRSDATMAWDAALERVVLFAGWLEGNLDDTWAWDDDGWVPWPTYVTPLARSSAAMAFDGARVVLFGGYNSDGERDGSTWILNRDPERRPAIQMDASFADAGIPVESIQEIRIRAHCGGAGAPFDPAPTPGAVLHGWSWGAAGSLAGAWLPLAANDTAPDGPSSLPFPPAALVDRTLTAEESRAFIGVRDRRLAFQCRPVAPSGYGEASVAMDYIEARIRYRVP